MYAARDAVSVRKSVSKHLLTWREQDVLRKAGYQMPVKVSNISRIGNSPGIESQQTRNDKDSIGGYE
jgi:hypothetical protein